MIIKNRKYFSRIVFVAACQALFVVAWLQYNHGHSAREYLMAHIGEAYAVTHDNSADVPLHEKNRFTGYEYEFHSPFHCEFLSFFSQQYNLCMTPPVDLPGSCSNIIPLPESILLENIRNFHFLLRAPPLA
jgi:hypothetical protein